MPLIVEASSRMELDYRACGYPRDRGGSTLRELPLVLEGAMLSCR